MTTSQTHHRSQQFINDTRSAVSQFRMPTNPLAKVAVFVLGAIVALWVLRLALGLVGLGFGLFVGLIKLAVGLTVGLLGLAFALAVPLLIVGGIVVLVKALRK